MSDSYQVSFENEFVRIVYSGKAFLAGQKSDVYIPAAVPAVRIDLDSRKTQYVDVASRQEFARASDKALREILVELKGAPPANALTLDAVRVDPSRYKVEFENDVVRVVRLGFGPREKGVMVEHPPRVLATLSEVSVKLIFQDGRTDERGAPAGVAAWLERETLLTANASSEPLEVILVEPKSARGF
jgi:hypothetical protein